MLRKTDSTVIDGFGYGAIEVATYTEAQPAPAPTTKGGFKRKVEGFDTNNNSLDFERVANGDIDLRNSQSRLANAGATIATGTYSRLMVTGNASLTGDVIITDKVVLQNGMLQLFNNNLTAAKTEGGSASSYVQTNGAGGLILQKLAATNTVFPIGNATYNPVTITSGGGVDWQAQVTDNILHQPVQFDKTKAVLRTWQVAPLTKPGVGATILLQYNDNDPSQVGSNFSKSDVQVWNYNSNWSAAGMHQKPVETNGTKSVTVNSWQLDGTFVISNVMAEMAALTILPIRLTDVKAVELPHAVQIEFTNSTEKDVARYEVERSANGTDFITIATIKPLHNNGGAAAYQWQDKTRPTGNIYYRIKGVETNGTTLYSTILKIDVSRSTKVFSLFPNPVKGGQLTWEASLPGGRYLLRVTGSNGQQVMIKHVDYSGGNISQVLPLPKGMHPGVYTLQIINGNFIRQQSFVVL